MRRILLVLAAAAIMAAIMLAMAAPVFADRPGDANRLKACNTPAAQTHFFGPICE
jgi:hypothetical protein